jgi:hypothetical protein
MVPLPTRDQQPCLTKNRFWGEPRRCRCIYSARAPTLNWQLEQTSGVALHDLRWTVIKVNENFRSSWISTSPKPRRTWNHQPRKCFSAGRAFWGRMNRVPSNWRGRAWFGTTLRAKRLYQFCDPRMAWFWALGQALVPATRRKPWCSLRIRGD